MEAGEILNYRSDGMIILIAGASHTGKTNLAQELLEKYKYPYLSIDHLKMGLIRSGHTTLTPSDNDKLTVYLWPIIKEIIKTSIENEQNLIVEGCYIPFDWAKDFEANYLLHIKYVCLVMSENYIIHNFKKIRDYASVIEERSEDCSYTLDSVLEENSKTLKMCQQYDVNYILIDTDYKTDMQQLRSVLQ